MNPIIDKHYIDTSAERMREGAKGKGVYQYLKEQPARKPSKLTVDSFDSIMKDIFYQTSEKP